jgi:hypothetical protein
LAAASNAILISPTCLMKASLSVQVYRQVRGTAYAV